MRRLTLLALAFSLSACATKAEMDELTARVDALDKKVTELESRKPTAAAGAAAAIDPEAEGKAKAILEEVSSLVSSNQVPAAKAKLDELFKNYGSTRTAQQALRTKQELDVVGKKVTTPAMEKWFTGGASDLSLESGTTLLVFWEVWCPHCQREAPKVQATFEKYKGKINVVGLTKITKSATEEKVVEFIKEKGMTYPNAKETGDASKAFAVSGIPAAAVVKNGEVVWRGHPANLTDAMLEGWI